MSIMYENDYVFVPTDGPYRWVVLFMAFCSIFIGDGVLCSFGIFLMPLCTEFNTSIGSITYIYAVLIGFYILSRPIIYGLINRFGFQIIGFSGGILCFIGYSIIVLYPCFTILLICNGFLVGVGSAIIYSTSTIVVNFYFEKNRAIANGLASTGSSFGTVFLATWLYHLEITYGLHSTYFIIAFLMLIPSFCSLFYLPLTPVQILTDIDLEIAMIHDAVLRNIFKKKKNLFSYQFCCCKFERPMVNQSFPSVSTLVSEKRKIVPNLGSYIYEPEVPSKLFNKTTWIFYFRHLLMLDVLKGTSMRPFYRDDIFYGSSLNGLKVYRCSKVWGNMIETLHYHMLITRISERDEYEQYEKPKNIRLPKAFIRTVRTMIDTTLMTHPSVILNLLSSFALNLAYPIPMIYIYDRCSKHYFKDDICAFLISTTGIGFTVGTITNMGLSEVKRVNYKFYCAFLFLSGGFFTIISGTKLFSRPVAQFVYAFLFGYCCTAKILIKNLLVELYGIGNLTNIYGLTMMSMGLSGFIGLVFAGFAMDWIADYDVFYFSGGCLLVSGTCMIGLGIIAIVWRRRRKKGSRREGNIV